MSEVSKVDGLLEEILDSNRLPEQVCATCPELLDEVRSRLRKIRSLEAYVELLFPSTQSLSNSGREAHDKEVSLPAGCKQYDQRNRPPEITRKEQSMSATKHTIQRERPSDIAFTHAVKAIQTLKGSRSSYARMERAEGWQTTVTPELGEFLADLDMFYLGTANADDQPYIQYRGGSPGFLKVIDEHTLGFADFGGNRQYITLGNLSENSKAFLFLMDYANSRRVKVWGNARVVEGDAKLENQLHDPTYPGKVERVILFTVEAWDVNCQQHIHQRYSQRQIAPVIEKLQERVRELEAELASLRNSISNGPTS